ncbi:MAG: Putative ATP:guanido phosphotransferase YacI (EC [uncultured Sulfurovum sp.]|uniref:ATP:guanido phosphotransferase YacI (EC) n=1 Tax=uncultured Sulfurovum sp. TaxID=269237 RepID=A0A6S6TFK2_9BACT|nr:MAG: Putative ATP:guanido phosphotransferase YacI (EC [uncultured Sulfurovum sp.]
MTYPEFPPNCTSLLCKHLSSELFEMLKNKSTANGFTLEQAINSGLENSDSEIGVYAGDAESYDIFAELFDKIIEDYHGFSHNDRHHSNLNFNDLKVKDFDEGYVLSTRIRVGRNVKNMPLGSAISKAQRNEIETKVSTALNTLEGELEGEYHSLLGMSKEIQERLIEAHFLFKDGDRFLEHAGLNRDWPHGRGIYHNHDKTFLVWLNEEDQLRIISMQQGGEVLEVFSRLVIAMKQIETQIPFAYSERLGYISSCPTNLGTAMRASVHIKLPNLSQNMEQFKAITQKYFLQIRGVDGEHTQSKEGIFDISNYRRLGITEIEAVQEMMDGVTALIEAEKNLELMKHVESNLDNDYLTH